MTITHSMLVVIVTESLSSVEEELEEIRHFTLG